ncbi:hypothetical protein MHU86_2978 [Fragilaria crotonensis]|nr:hypothetical protein MHU86_2978 [Fragilaria crotonensis]
MVTFRKASKKRGAIRSHAAEEEEDDESDSALGSIQLTQKKQKLVQATLYKRGLDATKTLIPEPETLVEEKATVNEAQNLLFKTTFSSTENGPTETVMQQKHMSAMEEFINRKLKKDKVKELENSLNIENHIEDDAQFAREADMGAGGTMLGGTGIAEVILPVETRIENAKQTEELRTRLPGAFGTKAASSAGYRLEQSDVRGMQELRGDLLFMRRQDSSLGHVIRVHATDSITATTARDEQVRGMQELRGDLLFMRRQDSSLGHVIRVHATDSITATTARDEQVRGMQELRGDLLFMRRQDSSLGHVIRVHATDSITATTARDEQVRGMQELRGDLLFMRRQDSSLGHVIRVHATDSITATTARDEQVRGMQELRGDLLFMRRQAF